MAVAFASTASDSGYVAVSTAVIHHTHTHTCSTWEKVASLEQTQNCASAKLESDKDNKLFNLFVSGADYHGNRSYVFSWVRTDLLFSSWVRIGIGPTHFLR